MKKYFYSTILSALILALTPWCAQSQTISDLLPLDGINFFDNGGEGCNVSYDPATKTITYDYPKTNVWGAAGWRFSEGALLDLSAYESLTFYFEEFNFVPGDSYIELSTEYATIGMVNPGGNYTVTGEAAKQITLVLNPEAKNAIKSIRIKCANAGTFKIVKITATLATPSLPDSFELLPLDGINFFDHGGEGCNVSFDPATRIATYAYQPSDAEKWGSLGWDFSGGDLLDLSAYSSITFHVEDFDFVQSYSYIELDIKYATIGDKNSGGKYTVTEEDAKQITINLDPDAKNAIQRVYLKSSNGGSFKILKITATLVPPESFELLPLDGINFFDHGGEGCSVTYDPAMRIATYEYQPSDAEKWGSLGWDFSGGDLLDLSAYSSITFHVEGFKFVRGYSYIELDIKYATIGDKNSGGKYTVTGEDAKQITIDLDPDAKNAIQRVYLKSSNGGSFKINKITAEEAPILYPDLIITSIIWEPEPPIINEDLLFAATVKNIGDKATPNGVKHGVVFRIYTDTEKNEIFTTWSDNHFSSIAPGEEVLIKMRNEAGEGTGKIWKYPGGIYYVKAEVNDTNDFTEISRDNNFSEFFEFGNTVGIQSPSVQGSIYVENGVLKLTGYSPSAIVTVYNLQGQKQKNDYLMNGIYIVKVIDNNCLSVHKVVAN